MILLGGIIQRITSFFLTHTSSTVFEARTFRMAELATCRDFADSFCTEPPFGPRVTSGLPKSVVKNASGLDGVIGGPSTSSTAIACIA